MVPAVQMSELSPRELSDLSVGSLRKCRVGMHPLIQNKHKKFQLPGVLY